MSDLPIRLFWWKATRNFGDRISAEIVRKVSGRPVVWADPAGANLFALGSILQRALGHVGQGAGAGKPLVWGSGLIGGGRFKTVYLLDYVAVRGPLTQSLLELAPLPLGDPGLLANLLLEKVPERTEKIGVVLHFSQAIPAELDERLQQDDRFTIIDVQQSDHIAVVRQIASCRHIFSSSLHGLIVADAFGVPNTWLNSEGIHRSAGFKFHDYALSVRRLLNDPIDLMGLIEAVDRLPSGLETIAYQTSLDQRRADLQEAFPRERLIELAEAAAEKT